ncbi:MAG: hypothetical protein D6766_07240 [Verrucomicrobia bacterium]|nr:MAG: hypothetical protein D6766_07240 [Verrucomicrobiota bacterium]
MARKLTEADARRSLSEHARSKGEEIRAKYGVPQEWTTFERILQDRSCVRYPCRVSFDTDALRPGEFAYPEALGEHPREGYHLHIHPYFANRPADAIALALYQLVVVNYGDFASAAEAESFGAAVLGMDREAYYQRICALADELAEAEGLGG